MNRAVALWMVFLAGSALAAPGENHWGEPTEQGALHQALADNRALIEGGDAASASEALARLATAHPRQADVFNLLGFARRKSGDLEGSASAYARALDLDPNHLGALEYQGELFLAIGEPEKAKANLARLTALCGTDCEERDDLAVAIAAWQAAQ